MTREIDLDILPNTTQRPLGERAAEIRQHIRDTNYLEKRDGEPVTGPERTIEKARALAYDVSVTVSDDGRQEIDNDRYREVYDESVREQLGDLSGRRVGHTEVDVFNAFHRALMFLEEERRWGFDRPVEVSDLRIEFQLAHEAIVTETPEERLLTMIHIANDLIQFRENEVVGFRKEASLFDYSNALSRSMAICLMVQIDREVLEALPEGLKYFCFTAIFYPMRFTDSMQDMTYMSMFGQFMSNVGREQFLDFMNNNGLVDEDML